MEKSSERIQYCGIDGDKGKAILCINYKVKLENIVSENGGWNEHFLTTVQIYSCKTPKSKVVLPCFASSLDTNKIFPLVAFALRSFSVSPDSERGDYFRCCRLDGFYPDGLMVFIGVNPAANSPHPAAVAEAGSADRCRRAAVRRARGVCSAQGRTGSGRDKQTQAELCSASRPSSALQYCPSLSHCPLWVLRGFCCSREIPVPCCALPAHAGSLPQGSMVWSKDLIENASDSGNSSSTAAEVDLLLLFIFQETFGLSIVLLLGSVGFSETFLNSQLSEAGQGQEADFPTPGRFDGITKTTQGCKKLLEIQQWSKATSPVGVFSLAVSGPDTTSPSWHTPTGTVVPEHAKSCVSTGMPLLALVISTLLPGYLLKTKIKAGKTAKISLCFQFSTSSLGTAACCVSVFHRSSFTFFLFSSLTPFTPALMRCSLGGSWLCGAPHVHHRCHRGAELPSVWPKVTSSTPLLMVLSDYSKTMGVSSDQHIEPVNSYTAAVHFVGYIFIHYFPFLIAFRLQINFLLKSLNTFFSVQF
ncbi:hypothetical protein EK904_007875 [Melospiza melodia maxima]|nr:hypothetical protein EK904_007875 [Melospiza melodia maxima]